MLSHSLLDLPDVNNNDTTPSAPFYPTLDNVSAEEKRRRSIATQTEDINEALYAAAYADYVAFLENRDNYLLKEEAAQLLTQVNGLKERNEFPLDKLTSILNTTIETIKSAQAYVHTPSPEQQEIVNKQVDKLTSLSNELIDQKVNNQLVSLTRRQASGKLIAKVGIGVMIAGTIALACSIGVLPLMGATLTTLFAATILASVGYAIGMVGAWKHDKATEEAKQAPAKNPLASNIGLFSNKVQQYVPTITNNNPSNTNNNRPSA